MSAHAGRRQGRADELPGLREERRTQRSGWLGTGSLACPTCDAPTPLMGASATPATPLGCPYCDHLGTVSDFLTLAEPHRAPRVNVWVRVSS